MVSDKSAYFGFLTVSENAKGVVGGYLVLNHAGRPVEFHCTSPVRANRAQEILYGATLEPFLYGEQIGQTLIARAKNRPDVILTDSPQVLAAQEFVETPVVFILKNINRSAKLKIVKEENLSDDSDTEKNNNDNSEEEKTQNRSVAEILNSISGIVASRWTEHNIKYNRLAVPELSEHPAAEALAALESASRAIDLTEPFDRIRLAVEEAQKAA
jgi:hypothetical protein